MAIQFTPGLPPHHAEISALHEAAKRIHWEAQGKPYSEQTGYYGALAIVNEDLHRLGAKGFGE